MSAKSQKCQLYVVHHEKEDYPVWENDIIIPIQAGRAGAAKKMPGMIGDDTGQGNISAKSPWFSEFSVTHWIWKNCRADYIGLMHYRRAFNMGYTQPTLPYRGFCPAHGLSLKNVDTLLSNFDAAVFEPMDFNGDTIKYQFEWCHRLGKELKFFDETREFLSGSREYRDMVPTFDQHFTKKNQPAYFLCCIVAQRNFFMADCQFVFDVLFHLEGKHRQKVIDGGEDGKRLYAFFGERLMSLYIAHAMTKNKKIKLLPLSFYEKREDFDKYENTLSKQYHYRFAAYSDTTSSLRYIFYHTKVGEEAKDKRISLNINYLGHDRRCYSAVLKSSKGKHVFQIYGQNQKQPSKVREELDFINAYNEKCFARFVTERLEINENGAGYYPMDDFVYQHWDGVRYRASVRLWNEPDVAYNTPNLQNKFLFVQQRAMAYLPAAVSDRLYFKNGKGRFYLEKHLADNEIMRVHRFVDEPGQAGTDTTESEVAFHSNNTEDKLRIKNGEVYVNSVKKDFFSLDDWDGIPYEAALARWYPFDAYKG